MRTRIRSAAARREMLEETCLEAARWASLGRYVVDGNRGCGVAHLYLALDATRVAGLTPTTSRSRSFSTLGRQEVEAALLAGEFKAMSWATAVALALLRLDATD